MCGIVGAVAQRDVADILVEGLKRLEYRGYDSAGVAIIDADKQLQRVRRLGKVQELADAIAAEPMAGGTGIAHTRWATHGQPSEGNAHPHVSSDSIAIVHNGIIENHESLRARLQELGHTFSSATDTEVIAHLVAENRKSANSLLEAVQVSVKELDGAYGTVIMEPQNPDRIVVARSGSPLVIGLGMGENFVASDQLALLPVTRRFIFLEEGDVAEITQTQVKIFDIDGNPVEREINESNVSHDAGDKGEYRHYMLKEIHEQPASVRNTLVNRINEETVIEEYLGDNAAQILEGIDHVQIIACGTSYHSGMVARYWLESLANVSCNVEIASEFRYRKSYVPKNSLIVTISQSGETADTLAALRLAKEIGYKASLTVCNVPGSSLVRESDLAVMTNAGAEIGVASTKAFTTQLVALLMLTAALGKQKGMSAEMQKQIVTALATLPTKLEETLAMSDGIEALAEEFADKHHSLFLGRGEQYPIAMEGALKLKEISYIHAEAYPAGELKHGPLALVDKEMPVVTVAPNNALLDKLKANLQEVKARGGELFVFAGMDRIQSEEGLKVEQMPDVPEILAPIVYTIPLQLLSYHAAVLKGTDVDQPRNLAKSVTVE